MAYKDFRDFLEVLRDKKQLIDINRFMDLKFDIAKALKKANYMEGPAINFTQNGTCYNLVGNVYSTRQRALMAFQSDR